MGHEGRTAGTAGMGTHVFFIFKGCYNITHRALNLHLSMGSWGPFRWLGSVNCWIFSTTDPIPTAKIFVARWHVGGWRGISSTGVPCSVAPVGSVETSAGGVKQARAMLRTYWKKRKLLDLLDYNNWYNFNGWFTIDLEICLPSSQEGCQVHRWSIRRYTWQSMIFDRQNL